MASYCDESDLAAFGLPRGSFPNPARQVARVDLASDSMTLDEHGFSADAPVVFRPDIGSGSSLPAPIVEGSTYYAIPVSDSAFKVAATIGGSALDLTTEGATFLVVGKLDKAAAIRAASAVVDDMLPAHVVPLVEPYPEIIRLTAAELATARLMGSTGLTSQSYTEVLKEARIRVQRWAKGIPVRGENAPARSGLSAAAGRRDSRGWSTYGGIN